MRRSIITTFFTYMSLLASLSVLVLGGALLLYMQNTHQRRAAQVREHFINEKKELVRLEVQRSVDLISYLVTQAEPRLHSLLQERLHNAHGVATQLYEKFRYSLSAEELQELIKQSLRHIRYDNGRGYLFAIDFDGVIQMHGDHPPLEGRDVIKDQVPEVGEAFGKMLQEARKTNSGILSYPWTRPGEDAPRKEKITLYQYFAPFEWLLCLGEYQEEVTRQLQEQALAILDDVHFDIDGYIFAGTWEGLSLLGPAKGKNVYNATDIHGTKVVQELIKAAKNDGGFVTYVIPPVDPAFEQHTRLSYSMAVPEWQWYVGAGVSLDEVEGILKRNHEAMSRTVTRNAAVIIGLLLAFLLLNLAVALNARSRLSKSFSTFNAFFRQGIKGFHKVDRDKLTFAEFDEMAVLANQMIEGRMQAEVELENMNHHLEHMVEERTEELISKARELEAAIQRLRDVDETKSTFLNTVSHDLRTPMTSVLGFAKMVHKDFKRHFVPLAQQGGDLGKYAQRIENNLEIIKGEGDRLLRLIGDFLDLAKIEAGKLEWNDQEVDVRALVDKTAYAVDSLFSSKPGIEFEIQVDDDLPRLRADPDRLQQVLVNLLQNAAKFTPWGKVTLHVEAMTTFAPAAPLYEQKAGLRFSIIDTGIGIDPLELERIFDKFHQAKREGAEPPEGVQGAGLGLAICKQIVERYSGRIRVESTRGKGSAFHVELPAQPPQPGGM